IVSLFEQQVLQTPNNIAVIFEEEQLTYQQLNERSNQLAHYLKSKGVKEETLVPICLDRSVELILAILGILKAGAAYVPLDPHYPQERIAYMLKDTRASLVLSSTKHQAKLATTAIELINLEELVDLVSGQPTHNLCLTLSPQQLAYVIYTSGSTGTPKGVLVEHRGVVSLVRQVDYVQLSAADVLLSTGSPSFDATTFEYWGMLLHGGQLVLCSEDTLLDSGRLKDQILKRGVTKLWLTSSWCNQLVEEELGLFESLQTLLVGGEKLSAAHMAKLSRCYPSLEIINGYGPTENTTFSLTHCVREADLAASIPIGRPLAGRSAYILSAAGSLQPIGVVGEICVGGAGLARGYLNREELT
ncbi:amino acid adenylation domain-containing protein, partial [Chitinophagaceae bacterium LB-8]